MILGYRHIYLESYKGECLAPASLFVHIEITKNSSWIENISS